MQVRTPKSSPCNILDQMQMVPQLPLVPVKECGSARIPTSVDLSRRIDVLYVLIYFFILFYLSYKLELVVIVVSSLPPLQPNFSHPSRTHQAKKENDKQNSNIMQLWTPHLLLHIAQSNQQATALLIFFEWENTLQVHERTLLFPLQHKPASRWLALPPSQFVSSGLPVSIYSFGVLPFMVLCLASALVVVYCY